MTSVASAALPRRRPVADLSGLSPEAVREVSEAIAAAELHTSAEIRVVVSRASLVQHPFFSVMWSALVSLVLPWAVVVVWPMSALSILQVQAIIFLIVAGILMMPQMTERAVPRMALKAAARAAAVEAFLAHGVSQTDGRTGILIFVAARERFVEVVADAGVHTPLGPVAWAEICDVVSRQASRGTLADGLVAAVRKAGELLAGPLPQRPGDVNEITDRVVII
ncbi:TPM domain-containing protein [Xanthobacter agilis]|uniref:Membrane protein n=1 Tax=Xanthobacter agilis TaxID=47492 RepID=A0ABU0LA14_XANAG|nr:hypothetical protein [Xanthobacter agilis]MDQ0503982.1 putative membrane protein [Xanthobacter agilis]